MSIAITDPVRSGDLRASCTCGPIALAVITQICVVGLVGLGSSCGWLDGRICDRPRVWLVGVVNGPMFCECIGELRELIRPGVLQARVKLAVSGGSASLAVSSSSTLVISLSFSRSISPTFVGVERLSSYKSWRQE